jgi:hypothetical protein
MKKRDRASSLFWMGFGILFIIFAWQLGLVKKGVPGPGFLPFICGIVLIGLALMILIPTFGSENKKSGDGVRQEKFFPEKGSLKRLGFALAALIAYGFCLPYGGFIITTFVFMLLMFRLIEPQRWRWVFLLSLFTAILGYLLFDTLDIQLPRGVLGI